MAGNLGARDLHGAAGRTEEALRADSPERLAGELHRLVVEVDRVRTSARRVVPEPRLGAATTLRATDDPLDAAVLANFIRLLRQQDLEAPAVFSRLSRSLERRLGAAMHAQLRAAMDDLDFAAAAELVADLA